jgi:spermidine/putrescine transport system substrate-binding protein
MMNRRTFLLGIAGAGLSACGRSSLPRLNVYNWSDYVAPSTIGGFEREFGVEVRYGTYESNEEMLAKVFSGNSGWDVVFPTHYLLQPMSEQGLLALLRHEWLPGLENLEAAFRAPAWDPRLERGVPYMWNSTGIAFNRGIAEQPSRWADLWDERLRGRITMLDDPEDLLGACLKKLRLPWSTFGEADLERAKQEALEQKPLLRAYLNAEVRDQLVAGDVLAAQLWSTTAEQAISGNASLAFVYPAEGFPLYCDCAVVLRESERARLAHQFIDYLLRPDVSARIAEHAKTATANAAARAILPENISGNPTLYPPPEIFERGEWPRTVPPEAQRLRDRIWTEIKSA